MTSAIVLGALTGVLLFATFASFLRVAHGFIRVFSFPRLQILALTFVLMTVTPLLVADAAVRWPIMAGQCLVAVVQMLAILPFTPLWKTQSKRFKGSRDDLSALSILSFNIKMSNRNYEEAREMVSKARVDIAVFMETDAGWCDALMPLADDMPHVVAAPLDNSYGMILFSRLTLSETSIDYLVMEDVPSINTTVTLRDGQRLRFHAVHPEPPVPYSDSTGRDAELLRIAEIAAAESLPSIVTGDLNDVAWSNTTRLFQRISRLVDPRIGRGFYNTFDARYIVLRWPLDHLFHDPRFALIGMQRLAACGSDHFPMLFRLALTADRHGVDMPEMPDAADHAEKREIIAEGKALERDAIGSDWET